MTIRAQDVMTVPVVFARTDTTLREASRLLTENDFRGLPVVDVENRVVGILSEADVLRYTQYIIGQPMRDPYRYLAQEQEALNISMQRGMEVIELVASATLDTLMTKEVVMVKAEAPVIDVIKLMVENNINRVPVVDGDGKLEGIVTRQNILKMIVERSKECGLA